MSIDIVQRLNKLREHPEVGSWYRMAKILEVTLTSIRAWRSNYAAPNEENLAKIVKLEKELSKP